MKNFFLLLLFFSCSSALKASPSTVYQFFQIFEGIDPGNENNATYAIKAATYKAVAGPHPFVIIDKPTNSDYTYNIKPLWFNSYTLEADCQELNTILELHPFGDVTIDCSSSSDWEGLKFIFDEGVTLEAIPCAFSGYDPMMGFNKIKNFSILGYGAKLLGQYDEHAAMFNNQWPCENPIPPEDNNARCYDPENNYYYKCWLGFSAQGRAGIHLMGCENIDIQGLDIVDMGSDGITLDPGLEQNYLWDHDLPSKNISIKNCSIENCGRVGICFCSSENSSVSHSKFDHNGYLVTGYDIDVEPFHPEHSANNISIMKCSFDDAANGAITLGPNGLSDGNSDFSVDVFDCSISNTEIGLIQVGGKFVPKAKDKVNIHRNAVKRLGNDDTPTGIPPNYGILYRSRFDCENEETEYFWEVDNFVVKELNTSGPNSFNANSYGIQISGRTEIPISNDNSCGESCALLELCPEDSSKEYFGGINLQNVAMYDEHAAGERFWERLVLQEKAPYCREDGTILNSFKNISTDNVVKVNPLNVEGNNAIMDDNNLDCDIDDSCDFSGSSLETEVFRPKAIVKLLSSDVITEGEVLSFKICTQGRRVNTNPIAVDYLITGTADNQKDYDYLTGSTVIPVGSRCRRCDIQTRIDCKNELGGETVNLQITLDDDLTYTFGKNTSFEVLLEDLHCGDFNDVVVEERESTKEQNNLNFSFYPNPSSDELNIFHEEGINQSIVILSKDGKMLKSKVSQGNSTTFNVSDLNSGIYFIGLTNKIGAPQYKKLIISK